MNPCGLNPDEVGGGEGRVLMGPSSMSDCQPLSIVIQKVDDGVVCLSRWVPSRDERDAISSGSDVLLYVWGWQVPVALGVINSETNS